MFEPIQNKNNYQYIVEQIKQMILDGELVKGDRLPSERELSEMYQVSRTSVREALKALETLGLLESRHGGGNYIADKLQDKLADLLSLLFVLEHCQISDLTRIRYTLELETMRNIMQKNDPEVRKQLQAFADRIKVSNTTDELEQIDMDFHALILSLAANPLLQFLHSSVHTAYLWNVEFLNQYFPNWTSLSFQTVQEYQADIINTLLSGDIDSLSKALDRHYEYNVSVDINTLYAQYLQDKKNAKQNS